QGGCSGCVARSQRSRYLAGSPRKGGCDDGLLSGMRALRQARAVAPLSDVRRRTGVRAGLRDRGLSSRAERVRGEVRWDRDAGQRWNADRVADLAAARLITEEPDTVAGLPRRFSRRRALKAEVR